jgi:hypothetical protein
MGQEISVAEFSDIVQEFASYKLGIQGCSTKTVDEYLLDLRTFLRYIVASREGIDPESETFLENGISLTRFYVMCDRLCGLKLYVR